MSDFTVDPQEAQSGKVYSVLAYIGILFLIPMLAAKDNKFARYHTNQGLGLFICELVVNVVIFIVSFIAGLTGIGVLAAIISLVSWVMSIVFLVFAILGIVNAVKGEAKPLPVVGDKFHFVNY